MTSKLFPGDPDEIMVIRDVTPEIVTFSVPFSRFGHFKIGGRATIVKLQTGGLIVFSPVALTAAVKDKVMSLGNDVKYLVAPDVEHHIFLTTWKKAFPTAQLIGPEGLAEKRASNPENQGVDFAYVITKENKRSFQLPEDLKAEFEIEYVDAHPNKEIAFFHRPTRTLIEADLVFNLPAHEQYSKSGVDPQAGALSKLFNGLNNLHGDAKWQKRFVWYLASKADRPGYAESVRIIAGWDFTRLIPCHGDVIEGKGKEEFVKLYAWLLELKRKDA